MHENVVYDDEISVEEICIPHPYTYLPCIAVKYKRTSTNESKVRWFDLDTKIEMPPYIGYGKHLSLVGWEPKMIYSGKL